ncbi:MAG TPA: pyridoxal phosphate-dependent aminotransferase [Kofleriaceae bacterium]|nr:pyridoxal phosphate-dependent aminotransferase [Kofleriaceae bacterium]
MPKHPDLSAAADALPLSIFARLYECAAAFCGRVIPFHIGDTYLEPPELGRLAAIDYRLANNPKLYVYGAPKGCPSLIETLVDKLRSQNDMGFVTADNVQVTSGATHALSCALRAVLNPGDELLLLSPYWPLIRGIALSVCVRPVDVALPATKIDAARDTADPSAALEAIIERSVTPDTSAIYVSTPRNPDGKVLDRHALRAIAHVAMRHNLWVLSDEVYENFVYDGRVHESIATLPGMAERTLTAFSFSKSFAQAGLRVGYLVGPDPAVLSGRKLANHTIYNVPLATQQAAHAALTHGAGFLAEARSRYQNARDTAVARLRMPTRVPEGSAYLFLDLKETGTGDGSLSILERLAQEGVLLAPGEAFGKDLHGWARLCFTAVPLEILEEGIDRINRVIESG